MAHSSNEYMQRWRSFQSAKHNLQDNWEQDFETRFIKEPTGDLQESPSISVMIDDIKKSNDISLMNQATYGRLYQVGKQVRKLDNLDAINKIYQEVWKELEALEAKLKEP